MDTDKGNQAGRHGGQGNVQGGGKNTVRDSSLGNLQDTGQGSMPGNMQDSGQGNLQDSGQPAGGQYAKESPEGSAKIQGDKLGDTVAAGASAGDGIQVERGGDDAGQGMDVGPGQGAGQGMGSPQGQLAGQGGSQAGQGSQGSQGSSHGGQGSSQGGQGQGSAGAATGRAQQSMSAERRREKSDEGVLRPPVDVIEDAQGITLLADLPGVAKENLNLRLDAQSLTIEGAMSIDFPQQMESRYAEIRHQRYERTFALSRELDGEKATAELVHGVLKIRIPKTAHATPRKIPVNVASA